MSTDTEMNTSYLAALKDAQRELAGMDTRRRKLEATIAGLKGLVDEGGEQSSLDLGAATAPGGNGTALPIPPNFFQGKTPTQAYRDFVRLWGEDHSVPKIRDAMVEGGIGKSKSELLPALHSVIRRDKLRQLREHVDAIGR